MLVSLVIDYCAYLVVRIGICVVQAFPLDACASGAKVLATFAHRIIRLRRGVIDGNLQRAFPQWSAGRREQVAWRMWEHLFLMVIEMAHAPRKLYVTTWRKYFRLRNADLLISTLTGERPTVVVAGHYGNFELSGFILGMFGFETFSVARPLDNQFLNRFVNDFRSMHGQHILPKIGSAALVEKYLARGATLAVLGDQSAGRKGMFVNFFGQSASTHKAIALFSLQHNAPLLIGFARRLGKPLHYEMGTEGVADSSDVPSDSDPVRYLTQWFTERLETVIREEPDQYWWVHRRWKDQPRKRKAASKAA